MRRGQHLACLLLGSNIQPEHHLPLAAKCLQDLVEVLLSSSVWDSPPIGSSSADFLNAALLIRTPLDPVSLKKHILRPLEAQLGRVRNRDKNAPRPIDLDLITFDDLLLDPTLWQFAHRAVPVSEVLPDYRSESGESLREAAKRLSGQTPVHLRSDVVLPGPSHPPPTRA
jgi:2-amino-4-hydroxy-6-hydroxymethyldihydropteridine diphosphokinase